MSLVSAMAAVLVTWVLLGGALVGVGLLGLRAAGERRVDAERLLVAFWVGYAAVVGVLQLWNFLWPITWHAELVVVLAGAAGLAVSARGLRAWAAAMLPGRRGALAAIALLGALVANQSIGPGDATDSGLYHYQLIRWANEHPVVPGLANLSPNYGLNPSSLLFVAMVDTGPWDGRSEHVGGGLLLWAAFAQVVLGISRLRKWGHSSFPAGPAGDSRGASPEMRNVPISAVYCAALLAPAVFVLYSKEVSSPRTDLQPGLLSLFIGWRAMVLLEGDPAQAAGRRAEVLSITALCALAAVLKVSAAFFTLPVWLLAVAAWWLRDRPSRRAAAGVLAGAIVSSTLLVLPWMGRHVVLSGYPMYPSTRFAMDVDWRVPETEADWFLDAVVRHGQGALPLWIHDHVAKSPLKWYAPLLEAPFDHWNDIDGWEWVGPWAFSLPFTSPNEVIIPILVATAAWLAVAWRRTARDAGAPGAGRIGEAAWILWPAVMGIAFWFLLKPAPRFAFGMTWVLAASSVAVAARVLAPNGGKRAVALVLVISGAAAVPAVLYRAAVNAVAYDLSPWDGIPFTGPGPDHGFHRRPSDPLIVKTTRWGLEVNAPVGSTHCWDAPLPCSGYRGPPRDLRLRREGDLRSGFMVDSGPRR